MKRLTFACVTLAVASLTLAASASAESTTTICVPEASSKPVLSTNTKGECPTKGTKVPVKYKSIQLPGTGGLETLNKVLPHVNYVESGVGGKPTVQFSGVNIQIVNGEGRTASANGEGNLVIGYNEHPEERLQTGSHNLAVGSDQEFTSWGGMLGGFHNSVTAPFGSVTGGDSNTASQLSSITGGGGNQTTGFLSSINGGEDNIASGEASWVGGGLSNEISAPLASIFGGQTLKVANIVEACGGFPTEVC